MNPEQVAEGLQKLKTILNEEFTATEGYRQEVINSIYDLIVSGKLITPIPKEKITLNKIRKLEEEDGGLVYIRSNHPSIVGKGEHQLVIGLGNNLVAKVTHKGENDIFAIGRKSYRFMKETKDVLSEIGIETPEMAFYRFYLKSLNLKVNSKVWNDSRRQMYLDERASWELPQNVPNICITPDLREGGRYDVVGYSEEIAKRLINRDFIISQFKGLSKKLGQVALEDPNTSQKPTLEYELHQIRSASFGTAISRMFLLQVPLDKKEEGRLVVGDIDHIYVYHGFGGNS